jgi:predicted enzyme related to lactoylglutathione lyase
MNKLNLGSLVLFVKDIEASKKFYVDILHQEVEMDFGVNVAFKSNLAIWQKDRALRTIFNRDVKNSEENNNVEVYFESSFLDEIWNRIEVNDVKVIHNIVEQPWKQRVFRIYDPDMFIVEVGEPMHDVVKRLYSLNYTPLEILEQTFMPLEAIESIINL